jgi:hypothetical protein
MPNPKPKARKPRTRKPKTRKTFWSENSQRTAMRSTESVQRADMPLQTAITPKMIPHPVVKKLTVKEPQTPSLKPMSQSAMAITVSAAIFSSVRWLPTNQVQMARYRFLRSLGNGWMEDFTVVRLLHPPLLSHPLLSTAGMTTRFQSVMEIIVFVAIFLNVHMIPTDQVQISRYRL